jgi:arsenate reductase (thioredoxin)
MKKILILCTGNSCRSQIAHGYFEHFTKGKNVMIYSAGIEMHGVNPRAIKTMQTDNIDISSYTSNLLSEYETINFDMIFTVCDNAKANCPVFPSNAETIHHSFPDPAKAEGTEEEIAQQFDTVRDMIKAYVKELADSL